MWDVRACRSCLAVKGKLQRISDGCKRLYTAITGVQIADGDGYPHYFCLECRTMVKKCLAFRRKSRRAHFVLKEIMSIRKQVTYSDIITVNRKKTNLTSSLGFWEPQKTHSVVITENEESHPDIEPTGPYNTRVVDIKPDKDNIEEERPVTPIEEDCDPPDDANDFNEDDIDIKKELLDIDLNDVFKDLEDIEVDIIPTPEPDFGEEKEKEFDMMSQKVDKMSINVIVQALEACDIKVMSLEEQIQIMEFNRLSREFVLAPFKCSLCLSVYATIEGLMEHVEYHNNRRLGHECQVCNNKYLTVEELNIHVARCHMYEYKCQCNTKRHCLQDIVKHTKECNYLRNRRKDEWSRRQRARLQASKLGCFTTVTLTPAMMRHVRAVRGQRGGGYSQPEVITEEDFKCDICEKWIKTKKRMEKHMLTKHRFLYNCNECREVFTERSSAIEHGRIHQANKVTDLSCEDCGVVYKTHRALCLHRVKKHSTKNTCNLCGNLFMNIKAYYKHQLTQHKYISLNDPLVGDPQYRCGECGIQFIDKRSLETHLVVAGHAGASDIEFACLPCKKIFENEEQLETHYITCKKASKYPRKCCYCPEMLPNQKAYQKHYNTEHPTLQYRYTTQNAICDICGVSIHKPQLEAHLKLHAGASYACRHCGARTAHPAAHIAHALAHAGKPYRCGMCPRRFQHKGDARDHILKVHAPTKLYKCEFCAQEFSFFRHLREHSEKLHNLIIPSVKNKCKKSNNKIYVYAHMKIEISEEERHVLEKTEVCLVDYLDQKSKPVDYKDYFIFLDDCDQILRVKRKRKAKDKDTEGKAPKVKVKKEVISKKGEDNTQPTYQDEDAKDSKMKFEIEPEVETENAVLSIAEEKFEEVDDDAVKSEAQEMVIDEERPLEVFENEGKQFVVIGGELYRIAMDDEE